MKMHRLLPFFLGLTLFLSLALVSCEEDGDEDQPINSRSECEEMMDFVYDVCMFEVGYPKSRAIEECVYLDKGDYKCGRDCYLEHLDDCEAFSQCLEVCAE